MTPLDKGGQTEELVRGFFLRAGYFVIRGAKLMHEGDPVTDVDLWLYLKGSPVSRERANVDIKDRDRPRALERVLWALGVKNLLATDRVIVATTDRRPGVRRYAARHGVDILDGDFLKSLADNASANPSTRMHEEEFLALVAPKDEKLLGDWRVRLEAAKERVIVDMSFDTCNALLGHAHFFLDKAITSHRRPDAARALYFVLSLFLVSLDYATRVLILEEDAERQRTLVSGFRYGSVGPDRAEYKLAVDLAETYAKAGPRVRAGIERGLQSFPAETLGEFFGKLEVGMALFKLAKSFEAVAFERDFTSPGTLDKHMQSVLLVLMDFYGFEREDLYSRF